MSKSSRIIPTKSLTLLVAGVVAAHLLVLQGTSMTWGSSKAPISRPFTTRMIELKPALPQPIDKPVVARATPLVRKAAPAPAQPVLASNSGTNELAALAESSQAAPPSAADAPAAAIMPASEPVAALPPPPPPQPQPKVAAASPSFAIPGSMRLKYNITGEVKKFGYSARAELLWLHDGNSYDARLEVSAFLLGSRVQTSTGRITAQGLAPTRFGDKTRSELAAHFERDKGKISFSANTPDAPLLDGAQDRLSVFIQLGAMIAGDPFKFPPATTIALPTVGARDAATWVFVIDGEENLDLPGGTQTTLKLTRQPGLDYDQKVELWLAPALAYLPVRIRLTQSGGDFIDQQWRATEAP
jgi:hypothetical protein